MSKQLVLVIERGEDEEIAGSVDTAQFLFTTVGPTEEAVVAAIRSQLAEYIAHEGQQEPAWKDVDAADIKFTIEYDLTSLFMIFSAIKIGSIAELAGINKGLLRQYASGVKSASKQQAKKVESAMRALGERLQHVTVA